MKLRTTLHLASFFPIFLTALFIVHLLTLHLSVATERGQEADLPITGAVTMAIFSLVIAWRFYRAGQNLVTQVTTLEGMANRVKHGDLMSVEQPHGGRGEVAAVAEVFGEMVGELRGYVDLIKAHEKLKQECDAAQATAERLRQSAVQVSGSLELLQRAERGIITHLLDVDVFLSSWLPRYALHRTLGILPDATETDDAIDAVPAHVRDVLQRLASAHAPSTPSDNNAEPTPPEPVPVKDLLEDTLLLCRWKWERERETDKRINVVINERQTGPFPVLVNRLGLAQTLTAILMNAADAMPDGGTIEVELSTDAGSDVNVVVTDSGEGMGDAVRTRCMKPFFSTRENRLGIGLTLASRLVLRHGGRLGVIGERDHGAAVHVTLPGPQARRTPRDPIRGPQHKPLTVLLVEDDPTARDTLATILRRDKHIVTAVEDGAAAVLQLRRETFDLVMTDRAMPIMTGEELAAVVKSRHPETPVILVTAAGDEMRRRHLQPEGVDVIVTKPVLRDDIRLAISRAVASRDAAEEDGNDS